MIHCLASTKEVLKLKKELLLQQFPQLYKSCFLKLVHLSYCDCKNNLNVNIQFMKLSIGCLSNIVCFQLHGYGAV